MSLPVDDSVRRYWRIEPGAGRAYGLVAGYNLVLGVVLLIGDTLRTSSAAFLLMRAVGGVTAWGVGFAVLGAVLITAAALGSRGCLAALALATVVHLWFATSLALSAGADPRASLTGPVTYTLIALWHGHQAIGYVGRRGAT